MPFPYLSVASRSLRRRRLRIALTIASVAIVVIGFFSLATFYTTIEIASPLGTRLALGKDVGFPYYCDLLVTPKGHKPSSFEAFFGVIPQFPAELAQYEKLVTELESLPEVLTASPHIGSFEITSWRATKPDGTVIHSEEEDSLKIQGIDPVREDEVRGLGESIIVGRYLAPDDYDSVIIGFGTAKRHDFEVGDIMRLKSYEFQKDLKVVGIFMTKEADDHIRVFITMKMAEDMFDTGGKASDISIIVSQGGLLKAAQEVAKIADYDISFPSFELVPQLGGVTRIISARTTQVAHSHVLILLSLAGCIFVFQAMLTNVYERTREIGIAKAVGWKGRHVLISILAEAFIIGIIGGGIGYLGGILVPALLEQLGLGPLVLLTMDPFEALGCLGLATLICVVAALIPAYIASGVPPIEAMRKG